MSGFRGVEQDREQMVLWSQRLDDAIPADHPVRLLDFALRSAAFGKTFLDWERKYVLLEGKPPFHPRDLAALYLYGLMNRIRSSRQLESACYNRLDVIWLMQGQKPDHSTIAAFVKQYGQELRQLFRDVVQVSVRAGLASLGHWAVDGSKAEGDAGKKSIRKEKDIEAWLSRLDEKIASLEAEWGENEEHETQVFGDTAPWVPSKTNTRQRQLANLKSQQKRLQDALQAIERRRQENPSGDPPKAIASTTDPDARVMKDKEGRRKPNYNTQLVVDEAHGVIVGADVNDQPGDSGQLTPMVDEAITNCGSRPQAVSADSGYNTGPELASMEQKEICTYIPDAGENSEAKFLDENARAALEAVRKGRTLTADQWEALPKYNEKFIEKSAFVYDPDQNQYRCPAGHVLSILRTSRDKNKWGVAIRTQYGGSPACVSCPHAAMCCKNPKRGRTINRDQYEEHRERQRQRLASTQGQDTYARRKQIVEPRFGQTKHVMGIRKFLRRGLEKVRTEWALACTAVNLGIWIRNWNTVVAVLEQEP